jgi:hypothetical protein
MFSIFGTHKRRRGQWALVLTAPFIYGMVLPLVFIDLCTTVYQSVCFPVYGIPKVLRKKYVHAAPRGMGTTWLDRFHCGYCTYANSVCAYLRAVLIETEKYWCPIKYALKNGIKSPHPQTGYANDGDIPALQEILKKTAE